jgi:hypothetical protein
MPANFQRYRLVAWMRLHRLTFREIGERLGVSHQRASQLYDCYLRWVRHQGWLTQQGKDSPMEITIPEDERAIIGYREFVDGTCRPVFEDPSGQYILDENGERVPGNWFAPNDEDAESQSPKR